MNSREKVEPEGDLQKLTHFTVWKKKLHSKIPVGRLGGHRPHNFWAVRAIPPIESAPMTHPHPTHFPKTDGISAVTKTNLGQGTCTPTPGYAIVMYRLLSLIYATADEAVAYMFYRCFFVCFFCFFFCFFPSAKNMRQPFSGTAERIFMKLLPNDRGECSLQRRAAAWSLANDTFENITAHFCCEQPREGWTRGRLAKIDSFYCLKKIA